MKWTQYRLYFLFASLFILFIGCPYKSEFPLSDSTKSEIDKNLLGKWEITNTTIDTVEFFQFNDNEYIVLLKVNRKNEFVLIRAFITKIKNHNFLNMQNVNPPDSDRTWTFENFEMKNDTLLLKSVESDIFKKEFNSSDSLYNFISENLDNDELYGKGEESILKRIQ